MHVIKHVRLLGVLSVKALCATLPRHLSVPFCSVTGPFSRDSHTAMPFVSPRWLVTQEVFEGIRFAQ